jgi:flagellar M-ring protein FliF
VSAEAAQLPFNKLTAGLKPIFLLVGVALAVAAGIVVALWSQGETYSLLYGDLGTDDSSQIVQALEAAQIPHKLDPVTGAITVPADRVHDARLKMAGQGLPAGDAGFALIAKDPGFGVSQFMEGARYQYALEGELARTISNLQPVSAARVHLALPRQSAFVRDRRPASASVLLQLRPGRRLEGEQVTAIVNLVASSIPELEATQVTVIDQTGRLLSAPNRDDEFAVRDQQFEYARRMEDVYTRRIESLLSPLVGPGRVRAQVVADVELAATEEAREQYKPESQVVRSEQLAQEANRSGAAAGGVPGALTNQPPAPGVALPPGVAPPAGAPATTTAQASGPDNTSSQTTRNYEIDRTIAYTKQPAGRLKRLTVAVLVDNLRSEDEDGEPVETALTQPELDNMTKLVRDAVGFDEKRGDSVNVVNASFKGEPTPEVLKPEVVPLWERPIVRDAAKLLLGLIVLLVLYRRAVKPLVGGLIAQAKVAPVMLAPVEGPAGSANQEVIARPVPGFEQQVTQARGLVTQDPRRVAQVVKSWVGTDE